MGQYATLAWLKAEAARSTPPIHHDPRTTTYPHECHPLIWADCAGCHQPYSLCAQVTDEAVGQIMDDVWRCSACGGAS